jgi:hypothetical protein
MLNSHVTSAHLSIVIWKMLASSEERFVGVLEAETDSFIENMKNLCGKLILFFLIQC